MVGHCIRQLVTSIGERVANDGSALDEIERAWEQLRERAGDRESLERVVRAIVPTTNFYFSTREQDGNLSVQANVE